MNKLKFLPFYLVSALPLQVLYFISDIAFVFVYHWFRYRRKVVRKNLIHSFPEKNEAEILEIERKFYHHFCDVMIESVEALTISKKSIAKRLFIKNSELIDRFHRKDQNIIMYMSHSGNWEWIAFLPLFFPFQVTVFYQPLSNKYFDQLMQLIRSRFGLVCIESNKGFKTLLKFNQQKISSINFMLGDQSPGKNSSIYWTNFLHRETAFLVGADKIAKKTGQAVVFPSFTKLKRGTYELDFKLIEESPEQNKDQSIIDKFAHILEENINAKPEFWLWSHKRWKLKKPENTGLK
jgi:Kdo2-lipid IVA lauroyltransferase/acyltransferase